MSDKSIENEERYGINDDAWEYQMQVEEARNEIISFLQNNWIEEFDMNGEDAIHSKSWHYSI